MRFSLKLPCPKCPFRKDVTPYLTSERAADIANAVIRGDKTFTCHEHIHGDTDIHDTYQPGVRDQHCAGAMAMVDKTGAPNAMLQIAERLGLRDRERLAPESLDLVYDSVDAMVTAYEAAEA